MLVIKPAALIYVLVLKLASAKLSCNLGETCSLPLPLQRHFSSVLMLLLV